MFQKRRKRRRPRERFVGTNAGPVTPNILLAATVVIMAKKKRPDPRHFSITTPKHAAMRRRVAQASWFVLLCWLCTVRGQTNTQISSANISIKVHEDCSDAPTEVIRLTCLKLRQIDRKARQALTRRVDTTVYPPSLPGSPVWLRPIPVPPNARGQLAVNPYDCMTLRCLCPFFRGRMRRDGYCYLPSGAPLAMAYRKEYRMMTDDERKRFHWAFNQLKQSGEYDRFATEHRSVSQGGAHSGPAFLPWHREFVKRMEIALRLIDPSVSIPYWDSVLDNYLPDARDSIMFSPLFAGEIDPNGFVVNGPFRFWRTIEGRSTILRTFTGEGGLFTEAQLASVANEPNIENVMSYTVPLPGCPIPINYLALEYSHSNVHFWVGGDLRTPEFSANDPIFYMHHSFVDLVFEIWRQRQQSKQEREWEYTADLWSCGNEYHFSYAWMRPFDFLSNRDGLSNSYTDQMYRYAPRPTCSQQVPTCGSRYLFCDFNHGWPHCAAKIKMGGLCGGYEGEDACFGGQCISGRCLPGPTPPPWRPRSATPRTPTQLRPMQQRRPQQQRVIVGGRRVGPVPPEPFRRGAAVRGRAKGRARTRARQSGASTHHPFVDCFNKNPCCDIWTERGECTTNKEYMQQFCRASCEFCVAAYNASDECKDRHVSCAQWAEEGECTGASRLLLEENCRQSCGLCAENKLNASCLRQPEQREPMLSKMDKMDNVTVPESGELSFKRM